MPSKKAENSFNQGALLVALGIRRAYLADTLTISPESLGKAIADLRKVR